jgi:hypothetical protein
MPRIASGGKTGRIGPLRSPMAKPSHGLIKKGSLGPAIADGTCRKDIPTSGARVRSAQTGGKIVKPF